ncbi:MAG TPA: hypothetical protein VFN08_10725 [Gemmatimonadales bacterium]|jgi:hypothetical protein|nr:hypothetical protein [Gemmatimonadales bacterium]
MAPPDRLDALLGQTQITGIDFVSVDPGQTILDVFFLLEPAAMGPPAFIGSIAANQLRIYATGEADVEVAGVAWAVVDGRDVLRITTTSPGGFDPYRLHIVHPRIDPYYNDVVFSFKANCPSDLDCATGPRDCPVDPQPDPRIDYLARDWRSLRQALLDFTAERWPEWQDRLEADVGMMLIEVLAALGDESAYIQDRIGREGAIQTAVERRSLRRHARLVDYQVHDGLGAGAWLAVMVDPLFPGPQPIPTGTAVWAGPAEAKPVVFEVGRGLRDPNPAYAVDAARNELAGHVWDERDVCLFAGSTRCWVDGHHALDLAFDDFPPNLPPGKWVLLETRPADPSVAVRRTVVRLIAVADEMDPLFGPITRLEWEEDQALAYDFDLTALWVRGNVVPATAGQTHRRQTPVGPALERFAITTSPAPASIPLAVERQGPNGKIAYLFSLPETEQTPLVWRGLTPRQALPELRVQRYELVAGVLVPRDWWEWTRSFVGTPSATRFDRVVTLDDGTWREVVKYQRVPAPVVHLDYVGGEGVTLRFGDGEFGQLPPAGSVFELTYRVGNGAGANVPADTLTGVDRVALPFIQAVTNPLPAEDGLDPESRREILMRAPEEFRAVTYRAVRPEDYAEAAERCDVDPGRSRPRRWVQRAGATFRWTGSWLSAFVSADPLDASSLSDVRRQVLVTWLDRFRQAGREVFVLEPEYADLDVEIRVCVEPFAYRGEVEERVLEVLLGRRGTRPIKGFFDPDNFTFGTPLERSVLEAVIQEVPGVRAVEEVRIRRRGWFPLRVMTELVYQVAPNEVIRVDNDPAKPSHGSLKLRMEGGA